MRHTAPSISGHVSVIPSIDLYIQYHITHVTYPMSHIPYRISLTLCCNKLQLDLRAIYLAAMRRRMGQMANARCCHFRLLHLFYRA